MSVAIARKNEEREDPTVLIPDTLIYEVVKGRPIYYRGYREVLNGTKNLEEIKLESALKCWLKAQIINCLYGLIQQGHYEIFTSKLGLNLPESTKRGADLAIYKSDALEINEFFANLPPEIIIEIDVAIDTEKQSEMDYVHEKIDDYLNFGVKKIVWIFTKTQKVIIADKSLPWLTYNWDKEIELLEETSFNLNKIMESKKK